MNTVIVIDGIGVFGNYFHYAVVMSLVGSSFLIFLYLWKKKRLNMDEEPKYQMLHDEKISLRDSDEK